MSDGPMLPHALGLTAEAFCRAYPRLWGGSLAGYRRLFREGVGPEGVRAGLAPIVRELREESPEGTVIKFVQDLGGGDLGGQTEASAGRRGPGGDVAGGGRAAVPSQIES